MSRQETEARRRASAARIKPMPTLPLDQSAKPIARVNKVMMLARVQDVLAIRLRGGMYREVREHAQANDPSTGRPWNVSDSGLRRYIERADRLLAQWRADNHDRLIDRHIGMRDHLYRVAVELGNVNDALAVLKDKARLQGLYPDDGAGNPDGRRSSVPGQTTIAIAIDLRGAPPEQVEAALASGATFDPRQLAALDPGELVRLTQTALRIGQERT